MTRHPTTTANRQAICALAALASVILAGPHTTHAQCQYEVTAIITHDENCWPFPSSNVVGLDMNSHGEVVGFYVPCAFGNERAFFWSEATGFVTLPTPPGVVTAKATGINDSGVIVGSHLVSGEGAKGFVFHPSTQTYAYLEPLHPGGVATVLTSANAINNMGIAVGSRAISKPGVTPIVSNAVIWNTNTGEVIDLGVMNGPNSEARAVNESGSVSGLTGPVTESRAFIALADDYENPTILLALPQGTTSFVNDMNDLGALAGGGFMDSQQNPGVQGQPAMWNNGWTGLGWLPGAHAGGARAINNLMQIGGSCTGKSSGQQAFLWQGGKMHNLNKLLSSSEVTLHRVFALNDAGLILCDAGAQAAVLSPIDRPLTDLNADCVTDVHDLLMLLEVWNDIPIRGAPPSPADFNGDGMVNVADLLILLAYWDH